jgi:hypothetical protein
VIVADGSAGIWVDEVNLPAGVAGQRFKCVFVRLGRAIDAPSLHAQAGRWASEKKGGHRPINYAGPPEQQLWNYT